MNGIQQTVVEGLRYLATKTAEGFYGVGDEAFQDDASREAFIEDLEDEVVDKTS